MFIRMFLLALVPLLGLYLYEKLRYLRFRQYVNWPQLKPSLLWGHMKALHEFIVSGETLRHIGRFFKITFKELNILIRIDIVFLEAKRHLSNPSVFILDLRPVQHVLCVVGSHEVAEQVSRSSKNFPYSMGKSPTMRLFEHLLGPMSILTAQDEEWKGLRKRLNPGFAPQQLMTLLPVILDKAWRFLENLDGYAASGEVFGLDELCTNLTFDIIGMYTPGVVVLDGLIMDSRCCDNGCRFWCPARRGSPKRARAALP